MNVNVSVSEVELVVREPFGGSADSAPLELEISGLTTVSGFDA